MLEPAWTRALHLVVQYCICLHIMEVQPSRPGPALYYEIWSEQPLTALTMRFVWPAGTLWSAMHTWLASYWCSSAKYWSPWEKFCSSPRECSANRNSLSHAWGGERNPRWVQGYTIFTEDLSRCAIWKHLEGWADMAATIRSLPPLGGNLLEYMLFKC